MRRTSCPAPASASATCSPTFPAPAMATRTGENLQGRPLVGGARSAEVPRARLTRWGWRWVREPSAERRCEARNVSVVKRVLVGRPLSSAEQEHQRITKRIALAVFSSDAISSTAYATEEILFVVALGSSSLLLGLDVLIPIAIAVAILLAIVVTSYRQTIYAYPSGGGSYVVCRENLGETPSLIAGASLLVDYILTVAVSISAGVAAIVSIPAFRDLADQRVAARSGADRAYQRRQPARHQGVGTDLRGPDLHLHRHGVAARRHRAVPELLRAPRPRPVRPGGVRGARTPAARSGSS